MAEKKEINRGAKQNEIMMKQSSEGGILVREGKLRSELGCWRGKQTATPNPLHVLQRPHARSRALAPYNSL